MEWNFADILDAVGAVVPGDRPALICGDRVVDWSTFVRRSNNIARALQVAGLAPGSRAAILSYNDPAYMEAVAGAFKARVMTVNLNYRYTVGEIAYVLKDCGAETLFYQAAFDDLVAELRAGDCPVRHWIRMSDPADPGTAPDIVDFDKIAETGDGAPLDIVRSPDDGYLLYTGGTTGMPKGVHWSMRFSRRVSLESPLMKNPPASLADHVELVREDRLGGCTLAACPLMHGTAFNAAITELVNGGTAVMLATRRFDALALWHEVERLRVTRLAIVGDVFAKPMLAALGEHPGSLDLSSLQVISSSGLSWSAAVKAGLLRHLPDVTLNDILAASEAAGFGWSISRKDKVLPDGYFDAGPDAVLIDEEDGTILPKRTGVVGLLARKGTMANGYYGDPAKTAATYRLIDGIRYVVPGDLASWVEPNGLMMIGRQNMSINTGGEKVFPEEVEEALKQLPEVDDALVVGLPDSRWGKMVTALVRATDRFDEAGAKTALSATLADYKVPKRFLRVDDIPRHPSGKANYKAAVAIAERLVGAA